MTDPSPSERLKLIASEILIAALNAKFIMPISKDSEQNAAEIAKAFKVILRAVEHPDSAP